MEELVELLAENSHNLYAKERIQQGWTYSSLEVLYPKENYFKTFISSKIIFKMSEMFEKYMIKIFISVLISIFDTNIGIYFSFMLLS